MKFILLIISIIFFACPENGTIEVNSVMPSSVYAKNGVSYFNSDVEVKWEVLAGSGKYVVRQDVNGVESEVKTESIVFSQEGNYDVKVFIYDITSKSTGGFSASFCIDKTIPSIKNAAVSIPWSLLASYNDDISNFEDSGSGVNINFIEAKWLDSIPESKQSVALKREVKVKDNCGNFLTTIITVQVNDNEVYPTVINVTDPGIIFKTTQLVYNFGDVTPDNKKVVFTLEENEFFTVSDTGLITPLKKGSAKITVSSVSAPSVKKELELNIDPLYRSFSDTLFTLVKEYSFKGTTIPTGWTNSEGSGFSYNVDSGLTVSGSAAETKIAIPVSTIGEFDYVEMKFKHTLSNTYQSNFYLRNSASDNGYKLINRYLKYGPSDAWSPDSGASISPNYKGGDWVVLGMWKKSNTENVMVWNMVDTLSNFSSTSSLYNSGSGDFMFGYNIDTSDSSVVFNVEYINFYKSN